MANEWQLSLIHEFVFSRINAVLISRVENDLATQAELLVSMSSLSEEYDGIEKWLDIIRPQFENPGLFIEKKGQNISIKLIELESEKFKYAANFVNFGGTSND